jgi:ATP-dependent DNA helicase RecG
MGVASGRYREGVSVALDTKLSSVLGDRSAKALQGAFGYTLVGQLLTHYPRRYATRGELTSISGVPVGDMVTLVGEVVSVANKNMKARKGSILEVTISDGTGLVTLTFFNQAWRAKDLVAGARGIFAGKVGLYRGDRQLAHPDYELFDQRELTNEEGEEWAKRPIPFYPATAKVASWQIARALGVVLDVIDVLPDPVPSEIASTEKLLPVAEALEKIHRPREEVDWRGARDTLRFHEAFVLQCALVGRRIQAASHTSIARVAGPLTSAFVESLPFSLTADQEQVLGEIHQNMAMPHPMNRLVQGEVGSGKTVVAVAAMVSVSESGGQSALLAPTEVLAWQHFRSIVKTLGPELAASLNPVLLTGNLRAAETKKALLAAASGQSKIVLGTHALLSERVTFADLGLVVVDEQHRFGVDQREALRQKGTHPHVLVLTATPIPRTVAMTVFGDLDVSTIRMVPSGRLPISTHVVALDDHPGWYPRVWQRVAEELAQGRQGFVVAPAISASVLEDDDALDESIEASDQARPLASVEETLPLLRGLPELAQARIEAVHGKLPSEEKDGVMQAFSAGEIDVVVATTVIEVGIDVPNASVMVILDADRFGVSQLHQLRGRVGRGEHAGVCLLVTHTPQDTPARARVDAVAATTDGFELARIDLELRSEGDVLGDRQSGRRSGLTLVRVTQDGELIEKARGYATEIVGDDPALTKHPDLALDIARRLDEASADYLAKN